MRDIKFRAWLNAPKRMIPFTELQKDFGFRHVMQLTLMQYIGLKDKNGKEIYEGDIATYQTKDGLYTGEIKPILGGYSWYHANIEFYVWDMDANRMEVIGNIHENPELLKGKS